jgi:hypothetical protein
VSILSNDQATQNPDSELPYPPFAALRKRAAISRKSFVSASPRWRVSPSLLSGSPLHRSLEKEGWYVRRNATARGGGRSHASGARGRRLVLCVLWRFVFGLADESFVCPSAASRRRRAPHPGKHVDSTGLVWYTPTWARYYSPLKEPRRPTQLLPHAAGQSESTSQRRQRKKLALNPRLGWESTAGTVRNTAPWIRWK